MPIKITFDNTNKEKKAKELKSLLLDFLTDNGYAKNEITFESIGERQEKSDTPTDADIIKFFVSVCKGIRQEYQNGASHRSLSEDIKTLKYLLENKE